MPPLRRRRSLPRASSRRRAAAALEYSLIFCVMTLGLGAMFVFCFPQLTRWSGAVARGIALPEDASPHRLARGTADRAERAGQPGSTSADMAREQAVAYGSLAAAAAVAVGAGGLLLVRARRRKARRSAITEPKPSDPAAGAPLELRSLAKRQELRRLLLAEGPRLLRNGLEVRHLMTRELITVPPSARPDQVRQLMTAHKLHHLLVCRGGRLLGLISDRDLCVCQQSTAEQMMRTPVITVAPETALGAAIHTLIDRRISCLPVVEADRLVGILSTTDLVLTLQCSLQLWLRMASSVHNGRQWVGELQAFSHDLQQDVAVYRQRVAELEDALSGGQARSPGPPAVARQAADVLATACSLAERLESGSQRLCLQSDEWIRLSDLRTDEATGLANRWELESILDLLLAVRKRYGQTFCVVLAAIVGPREAQTAAADRTRAAVEALTANMRASDFLARLDEAIFAVVLTQTEPGGATVFCQRLCAAGRGLPQGQSLRFQTAVVTPTDADTSADLLSRSVAVLAETAGDAPGPGTVEDVELQMPMAEVLSVS